MFKKILVGSDGSQESLHAAHLAAKIAKPAHTEVVLLNVFNLGAAFVYLAPEALACSEEIVASGEAAQQDALKRTGELFAAESVSCRTLAEVGHPVETTLRIAEAEKVDLIVVGSHGLGRFDRLLLGSVSDGVAHHAHSPVLVTRGTEGEIQRILVAVDGSETGYKALQAAVAVAQPTHAAITVIHILEPGKPFPGIDPADTDASGYALLVLRAVTERAKEILQEAGVEYRVVQEAGHPAEVLTEFAAANAIDLITVGSRGLGTFRRLLLGSTSHAVLHHAKCSVLIVR